MDKDAVTSSEPIRFAVGGPVQAKAGTYISRPVDDALYQACLKGQFSYVLACRQIGKSSLMNETARRLSEAGVKIARLDLNRLGRNVTDAESWYFSLLHVLAGNLRLNVDIEAWWEARPPLVTLSQRFLQFFDEVVLPQTSEPIVIFIDEIDMTLGFDFTDDFFGAIRVIHNERAQNPTYERLTFVLLGVATPDELIQDHTRTPFNIAQAITLNDFTPEQCIPLQQGIEAVYPDQGEALFGQIYNWTGGHPYLTQKLCQALVQQEPKAIGKPDIVETLVHKHFLAEEARGEDNIQFVQSRVLGDPQAQAMLKIYERILTGKEAVADDEQSVAMNRLKLYGLVLAKNGVLKVRNRLYAEVFDADWIKAHRVTHRDRILAIGAILILLATIVGLVLQNQRHMETLQQLKVNIETRSDETMETQFDSLYRLILLTKDNPAEAHLPREAFDKLSYAQQLFMFENATTFAHPVEYETVAEDVYTWLENNEDNNNLLEKIWRFSNTYAYDEDIEQLSGWIEKLLEGREHAANGRWEEAEAAYTEVIEESTSHPVLLWDRGQARLSMGNMTNALADFETFLTLAPDDKPVRQQLQNPDLRTALEEDPERFPKLAELLDLLKSSGGETLPTATPANAPSLIPDSSEKSTATSPSKSSSYDAPQLLSPENGVGRLIRLPLFEWRLEGYRLKEDEYFKLQIWLDDPQGPDSREFLLNSPRLDDEFIYPENGKVKWTVTVVQAADVNCVNSLCAGTTLNELSSASELRWFAYDNLGQVGEGVVQSPPIPTTALAIAAVTPTPLPAHQYTIRNVFGQVNEAITQIRGDIQDPNGQPVNGVRVRVRSGSFCTVSYPSGPTGGYPNGVYDILLNSRAKDGMWQVAVVDGPADSTNTACDSNLDVLSEEVTVPTNTLEGVVFVEWRKNY